MSLAETLRAVHDRVVFHEEEHAYAIDGIAMDPVTSACKVMDKPFLVDAAARLAREGKDHKQVWGVARENGNSVHRSQQNFVLRTQGALTMPEKHTAESAYLSAGLVSWLDKAHKSGELEFPFRPECRTFHPEHGYAGTMDLPCLWLGRPTILDLKTCPDGSSAYQEWPPQIAAYAAAAEFHTGEQWFGGALRVPKDGSAPSILPYGHDPEAFETFLALLKVYRWLNRDKKRNSKHAVQKAVNAYLERKASIGT